MEPEVAVDAMLEVEDQGSGHGQINGHAAGEGLEDKEVVENLVQELSRDYAGYLAIDSGKQRKSVEEAIEEALVHLEEFCGLLDVIRSDNVLCLEQVLNRIYTKSLEMETLYEEVDRLQEFVAIVRRSVEDMETQVLTAEKLLKNQNSVQKFFSNIWGKNGKNKASSSARKPKYSAPDIFRTEDYLRRVAPEDVATESTATGTATAAAAAATGAGPSGHGKRNASDDPPIG
jgi:cappuccino protein